MTTGSIEKVVENGLPRNLSERFIDVKTTRDYVEKLDRIYLDFTGIISEIIFSQPIVDFKDNENRRLSVKTTYYREDSGYYWQIILNDRDGYTLLLKRFGELNEDLSNYTSQRLKLWQEQAVNVHRNVLQRIEDLYWKKERIPKDIL